jgi:hypothetical protein
VVEPHARFERLFKHQNGWIPAAPPCLLQLALKCSFAGEGRIFGEALGGSAVFESVISVLIDNRPPVCQSRRRNFAELALRAPSGRPGRIPTSDQFDRGVKREDRDGYEY